MVGVTRMIKIGVRIAQWATPHVHNWHRERNMNRTEARRHAQARNWGEAERYFQAALAERERSSVDRLELLLGLAEAQRCQFKLEDSEHTAYEAIKIAVREKNDGMHALALDALASAQIDQQHFGDAEKTTREVMRLESARSKPDHARLALCSRKLASALENIDRPAEAMDALKTGLSHAEKAFGAEHAETASHLHELGLLHRRQGQHAPAQAYLRRCLQIHRTLGLHSGGSADPEEATQTLYNLAASLEESGDLDGAAAEFERMLVLRERQLGADPLQTASAQVRLAGLHLLTGRVPAARELLIHAMPALERKGGPELVQALEFMATAEDWGGAGAEARRYREKAMHAAAIHAAGVR
jgi:tetratricopeptide (TPR) repeat protein